MPGPGGRVMITALGRTCARSTAPILLPESDMARRRPVGRIDGTSTAATSPAAAVDLVCRDPADAVPGIEEPADHAGGQLRFGREDGVLAQARSPAAVCIARPRARDVQLPVHRRVPAQSRVDEVDGDLRVLDPSRRCRCTGAGHRRCACPSSRPRSRRPPALRPRRADAPGRTRARHRARRRHPPGPAEQVLHAVRGGLSGPLGDAPAVLARQVRQQPQHQIPYPAPGFNPGEPAGYPAHLDLERLLPAGRVYA
jgi:hypothetical protein